MGKSGSVRARHFWLAALLLAAILLSAACSSVTTTDTTPAFSGPPVVMIASPLTNDTYQEGVGVNILVRVENAGPDIARVAIQVDGQIIGEAPFPNPDGASSFTVRNGWPASGAGTHTISVVASRGDGTASAPASVQINVVAAPAGNTGNNAQSEQPAVQPTTAPSATTSSEQGGTGSQPVAQPTSAPTQAVVATNPPEQPTNPPAPTATPTLSRPQVRVIQGANVRSGPGLVFDPPVGSLAAGATAEILAVHTGGTWYKIRYYNGEAWIAAQVVETSGDLASLPRDPGPATPIPITPTPPPTATVATSIDLIIDAAQSRINQFPLVCNVASEARITVVNAGTSPSPAVNLVWDDVYNGQVIGTTSGAVPALQPNQNYTVFMYLTISAYIGEGHTARITVDPNNAVPETNDGNNVYSNPYVLARGGC